MEQATKRGFTLVELLVTISVIGILSSIIYANLGGTGTAGRDAKRKADLRNIQTAIEAYKQKNGHYPAGCRGANIWSGAPTTASKCPSGSEYIVGLAPEFISRLPFDPNPNNKAGYIYVSNRNSTDKTGGTVYKLMAMGTVESETVTSESEFKSCDTSGICPTSGSGVCSPSNSRYQKSYAVWGGYADVETETAKVICK